MALDMSGLVLVATCILILLLPIVATLLWLRRATPCDLYNQKDLDNAASWMQVVYLSAGFRLVCHANMRFGLPFEGSARAFAQYAKYLRHGVPAPPPIPAAVGRPIGAHQRVRVLRNRG